MLNPKAIPYIPMCKPNLSETWFKWVLGIDERKTREEKYILYIYIHSASVSLM